MIERAICENCQTSIPIETTGGLCPGCLLAGAIETGRSESANAETYDSSANVAQVDTAIESTSFGDYELLEEIARGGMGVVYKARHAKLNRVAAVKMILGGQFSSADDLRRFYVEAEAAARLDHPGIVPVYDIGESNGQPFFAMKYIEGGSLSDKMSELRADSELACRMLADVARAVHHAHQRGILHRDLKPANILIDEAGNPLVTDLGLAKSTSDNDSNLTKTGAILGTPSYMPPEQAAGEESVTTAADVYSLGAILYETITGRPPHQGSTAIETVMSVLNNTPVEPRKLNPQVAPELELICLKCLERNPEARYTSAAAVANDLESWLADEPISIRAPSLAALTARWMRKNRRIVYVALTLLMVSMFLVPSSMLLFGSTSLNFGGRGGYNLGEVYQHFPNARRPWFNNIRDNVPQWLGFLLFFAMLFLVWPSIGLWNAIATRPKSIRHAVGVGFATSAICASLLIATSGWLLVVMYTGDHARGHIRTLGEVVWPTEESTPAEALSKANELYEGLEDVPENIRAKVLADRIINEEIAQGPQALAILGVVGIVIAIPILYGTVVGHIVLTRSKSLWGAIIRYGLVFLTLPLCIVVPLQLLFGSIEDPGEGVIGLAVCAITLFLALRRPSRPESTGGSQSERDDDGPSTSEPAFLFSRLANLIYFGPRSSIHKRNQEANMNDSTFSAAPAKGPQKKSWLGCILGGCLGVLGFMVVGFAVASYMGYQFATGQVEKYTSAMPRVLPVVEYTDEQMVEIGARLKSAENGSAQQVVLSADDLNALISRHPSGEFKGKVYITLVDGDVKAEVSVPVDIPGYEGRFLNGSLTAHVSLKDGHLHLQAADIIVNGEKLPPEFVNALGTENGAITLNADGDFEKVEIVGDQLVLTPTVGEAASQPAVELEAESSEEPSGELETSIDDEF